MPVVSIFNLILQCAVMQCIRDGMEW